METVIRLTIFGLFIFVLGIVFIFLAQFIVLSKSTENYQTYLKKANVVIVFGFGLEEDKNGKFAAGCANDSIMNWIKENTNPEYIIAQKGCAVSKYLNSYTALIEMHPHGEHYVNTCEAGLYAIQKLDSLWENNHLENSEVLVIAHNYQIERAEWILKKQSEKNMHKFKYHFIVPELPDIPFPSNSSQFHTQNKYFYTLIELFVSRPRDYFNLMINN